MFQAIRYFSENKTGRDFIIGDVHGAWTLVEKALFDVNFNEETDRLFHVGDLVDRGKDIHKLTPFVQKEWFHGVIGNHEASLISWNVDDTFYTDSFKIDLSYHYWFEDLTVDEKTTCLRYFQQLPLSMIIELPDNKKAVICHADIPTNSVQEMTDRLTSIDFTKKLSFEDKNFVLSLIWSRHSANKAHLIKTIYDPVYDAHIIEKIHENHMIHDIDYAFFGHTVMSEVTYVGNRYFIDLGAIFKLENNTLDDFNLINLSEFK